MHAEKRGRATHEATASFVCSWPVKAVTAAATAAAAISSRCTPRTAVQRSVYKMLHFAKNKS